MRHSAAVSQLGILQLFHNAAVCSCCSTSYTSARLAVVAHSALILALDALATASLTPLWVTSAIPLHS